MNNEKEAEMANKKNVSEMVRGLSMTMRLLTSLEEKILERGGNAAMLHFLSTPSGEQNLDQIADLLVSLKWRVPKSVVMELAREHGVKEGDSEHVISDQHFYWEPALKKLGIPYIRFVVEDYGIEMEKEDHYLLELEDQLRERRLTAGMVLAWNDQPYIMTTIGYRNGNPMLGDCIDMENVEVVHLTPLEHIDLES